LRKQGARRKACLLRVFFWVRRHQCLRTEAKVKNNPQEDLKFGKIRQSEESINSYKAGKTGIIPPNLLFSHCLVITFENRIFASLLTGNELKKGKIA
jgi:hypothetical protein